MFTRSPSSLTTTKPNNTHENNFLAYTYNRPSPTNQPNQNPPPRHVKPPVVALETQQTHQQHARPRPHRPVLPPRRPRRGPPRLARPLHPHHTLVRVPADVRRRRHRRILAGQTPRFRCPPAHARLAVRRRLRSLREPGGARAGARHVSGGHGRRHGRAYGDMYVVVSWAHRPAP